MYTVTRIGETREICLNEQGWTMFCGFLTWMHIQSFPPLANTPTCVGGSQTPVAPPLASSSPPSHRVEREEPPLSLLIVRRAFLPLITRLQGWWRGRWAQPFQPTTSSRHLPALPDILQHIRPCCGVPLEKWSWPVCLASVSYFSSFFHSSSLRWWSHKLPSFLILSSWCAHTPTTSLSSQPLYKLD